MATKADFNAEEWSLILEGPPLAGLRVVLAEHGGTLRESLSLGKAYVEARKEEGTSELVDEIVAEQPVVDPGRFDSVDDVSRAGMQHLREAVELLERKAESQDVAAYKDFVMRVANRVASAHKEGGILGIGGKEVSDSERRALDEIATTLGVAAEPAA
jgi:hypothetical protein